MAKLSKRPLLIAFAGAAAVKVLACAPYPPGNLIVPPCPDGGSQPCEEPKDAGTDGGTSDGGMTDGGDGG